MHRAAQCRRPTHCYRCSEPGHLSYECPRRLAASKQLWHSSADHQLVWRPVSRLASLPHSSPASVAPSGGAAESPEPAQRRSSRRRRWCSARRREADASSASGSGKPEASGPAPAEFAAQPHWTADAMRPLCVIDRSPSIDWAEAELSCALFVSIGGSRPPVTAQQVLALVASVFDVAVHSMKSMPAAVEDFLLHLPDHGTVDRVFNRGSPIFGPGFSLHFKRWSRLALAEGARLPEFVSIELRGVGTRLYGQVVVWSSRC
jgi:hypothetical protein